jgi:hypothetical protein
MTMINLRSLLLNGYRPAGNGLFEKVSIFPQGKSYPRKEILVRDLKGRIWRRRHKK